MMNYSAGTKSEIHIAIAAQLPPGDAHLNHYFARADRLMERYIYTRTN